MAVGIRPSTGLARDAGLAVGRGVQVDDHMVTSDEDIMAVGECVESRGTCYGLVAPSWDMRSEERRVGQECVSTRIARLLLYPLNNNDINYSKSSTTSNRPCLPPYHSTTSYTRISTYTEQQQHT